jgi:long-chain acyl-CoA synthetase
MPDVDLHPDDDATILFTSGTTGFPKGAISTHRNLTQTIIGLRYRGALDRLRRPPSADAVSAPPCYILVVPLFHVSGCVMVMLSSFAAGLRVVMMYRWNADRALELIERERVTQFVGVSAQAWDLMESPKLASTDTSSLVAITGGGGPTPPQLVRKLNTSLKRPSAGLAYGMTETTGLGPHISGSDYAQRPTSSGRTSPVMQIEVRDEQGTPVPPNTIGEVWMKGPTIVRGYWDNEAETSDAIVDGWLRSGDLGRVDEDGFLYIEDRAKDMVIRGGENVYPAEVEAAVYEHPSVHEVAVFGVPHERLGEEVGALVVTLGPGDLTDVDLTEFLQPRLAAYKMPTVFWFETERLPRSASGKVLKQEVRSRLLANQGVSERGGHD